MTPQVPPLLPRITLLVIGGFNALSAVGGGIGLLTPDSMGIPLSVLDGSAFRSFLWPAVILIVVIGGTQTLAVVAELRRAPLARFWAAFAGLGLVIFIFVELAIMRGFSVLHGIYFATGIAQLALVVALLGIVPGLVRPSAGRI